MTDQTRRRFSGAVHLLSLGLIIWLGWRVRDLELEVTSLKLKISGQAIGVPWQGPAAPEGK